MLIVFVVIALIAAIAIPNLLSSRRASNEASAISALRTMASAQSAYHNANLSNYGTAAQLYAANLIDRTIAAANNVNVGGNPPTNQAKAGYRFRIQLTAGPPSSYVISAIPSMTTGVTRTGVKRYCLTENGVLKSASTSPGTHFTYATCNSATAFRP